MNLNTYLKPIALCLIWFILVPSFFAPPYLFMRYPLSIDRRNSNKITFFSISFTQTILSTFFVQEEEYDYIITDVLGPGQYEEWRNWIEAPVIDSKRKTLRLKIWLEFEGETASWFSFQPNPLILFQGEKGWYVFTLDVPDDVQPGVYEGVIRIFAVHFDETGEITEPVETTVFLRITIDPRDALLNAIDELEIEVKNSLDVIVNVSAETMALYDDAFDFNWFQELIGLGVTIADILTPTPDDLEKIPVHLQRLHKVLNWLAGVDVALTANSFWGEFRKWSEDPDKPSNFNDKVSFYRDKILNDYDINFTVEGAGGKIKLEYKRKGLGRLYDEISQKCEDLRDKIRNVPEDKLSLLTANYPKIIEIIERYKNKAFLQSKTEMVAFKKNPEMKLEGTDSLEAWVFGKPDFYELMKNATKEKKKATRWQWISIATTVGSTATTLCIVGGFFTGGTTWYISGAIALSGISALTGFSGAKHEVTAKEIAVSVTTQMAITLKNGKNGPKDLMGCFFDCVGLINDLITGTSVQAYNEAETSNLYSYTFNPFVAETSVSGSISLSTPNIIISEGEEKGAATGQIMIENTGSKKAQVTGQITVYIPAGMQGRLLTIFNYFIPSIHIKPGKTVTLQFPYFGVSSSWWGSSYLVEAIVTLTTEDGQTKIGPVTSRFYVGTREEISSLMQNEGTVIRATADCSGARFEKDFVISSDISSFSLILISTGGDFDLHLYDSEGNHVGYNYVEERVENQIAGAIYSGKDVSVERITVTGDIAGRRYKLKVYGYEKVKDETFSVRFIQTPKRPSIITVCPNYVREAIPVGNASQMEVQIQEVGGSQSATVYLNAEGDIAQWIKFSHTSLCVPPNSLASVNITVNVPSYAKAGTTYTGTLVVDAGKAGQKTIPIELTIIKRRKTEAKPLISETQLLRKFMTEVMLSTETGKMVTLGLYTIYQPFASPIVSLISTHETLKEAMRILLFPLIKILDAGLYIYNLLGLRSWNLPDIPIMVLLLFVSVLVTIAYMTPLILLLNAVKKIDVSERVYEMMHYVWGISVIAMFAAWFFKFPTLMMIGGTVLILSTIVITTLAIVMFIAELRKPAKN